ncbi:MAG: hypothetical protein Q6373_008910 [Candidatus Sigynarchaeota archaeon]
MESYIAAANARLATPAETPLDELGGLEILVESLSIKVTEILGKNTLLAMAYQIGKEPADKISERLLAARNGALFDHPVEAFVSLMENVKNYFHIQITSIVQDDQGRVIVSFKNKCYFRSAVSHRPGLKIGTALCRITKGYIETAIAKLTSWKAEVKLIGQDETQAQCIEQVSFTRSK